MSRSDAAPVGVRKRPRLFGHCLILLALSTAHAAETDVSMLQQEIQALRNQVRDLRARIETLEEKKESAHRAPAPASALSTPSYEPADTDIARAKNIAGLKQRWSRVARGMTGVEVTGTIGEPTAKLLLDGRPVWYYIYAGVGRGSVVFDGGGRVSSMQAPALGWNR